MDLQIDCKKVEVSANNGKYVTASIDGATASEILNHFSISDILEHFNATDVLDKIGQDRAMEYWDLQIVEDK